MVTLTAICWPSITADHSECMEGKTPTVGVVGLQADAFSAAYMSVAGSVPVVSDVASKRETVRNRLGFWGVGIKGIIEDWNDDFDVTASKKTTNATC